MTGQLRALLRSFFYAAKGIGYGIRTQRNLRIHLVALVVILTFNAMAQMSLTHWCIELLCAMVVISLELMNTALESACDQFSVERHPLIGHAKDAAAGAVLVSAIGAALIAVRIFFQGGPYYLHVSEILRLHSWVKYALLAGMIPALLFIFLPSILQTQKNR